MTRMVMLTELRLMLRSPAVWLVTALGAGLAAFAAYGASQLEMLSQLPELAFPFVLLGQMLLTAAAARRDQSERVSELTEALPYRPTAWVWGRLLVHCWLWVSVSVLLWVIGAAGVALAGEPLDLRALITHWAVMAPAAVAFAAGVSFLLGSMVRNAAVAYFLTAGAWILGPFGTVALSKGGERMPAPVLEYFASGRYFPLGTAGYYPQEALLLAQRIFTVGIGGLASLFLLWYVARRRGLSSRVLPAALALLLAASGASAAVTQSIWQGRTAAYEQETAGYPRGYDPRKEIASPVLADEYRLTLELDPAANRVRAEGMIRVTNGGDAPLTEIDLTLRRNFRVTGAADSAGQPLAFEREGDFLKLSLPVGAGETRELRLTWEGEVWQWRMAAGPKLGAHIAPESIMLPASYGWYPLPGRIQLGLQIGVCSGPADDNCRRELEDVGVSHRPASIEVAVTGSSLNLIHNAGDDVTGLYLIGTPLTTEVVQGIEVTASPVNRERAERLARSIAALAGYYDEIVPRVTSGQIRLIETPEYTFWGAVWRADSGAFPGAVLVHQYTLGAFTEARMTSSFLKPVLHLWWPAGGGLIRDQQDALVESMGRYMEVLRSGERNTPVFEYDLALQVFETVEDAKGREAVIALLREMHGRLAQGGPTVAEFQRAALSHAGNDPAVAEKLNQWQGGPGR